MSGRGSARTRFSADHVAQTPNRTGMPNLVRLMHRLPGNLNLFCSRSRGRKMIIPRSLTDAQAYKAPRKKMVLASFSTEHDERVWEEIQVFLILFYAVFFPRHRITGQCCPYFGGSMAGLRICEHLTRPKHGFEDARSFVLYTSFCSSQTSCGLISDQILEVRALSDRQVHSLAE